MIFTIITLVLLALSIAGCLGQYYLLKREIWRERQRSVRESAALKQSLEALSARLAQLEEDLEVRDASPTLPDAGGMNFSRRTRVLRMYRRGGRPDQIAAALGIPVNEVNLLLKLQQLAEAAPDAATA